VYQYEKLYQPLLASKLVEAQFSTDSRKRSDRIKKLGKPSKQTCKPSPKLKPLFSKTEQAFENKKPIKTQKKTQFAKTISSKFSCNQKKEKKKYTNSIIFVINNKSRFYLF